MKILSLADKDIDKDIADISAEELISKFIRKRGGRNSKTVVIVLIAFCFVLSAVLASLFSLKTVENRLVTISLADTPISATASKRDIISIPTGMVKANPFVPYRNIDGDDFVSDVPKYDLVAPPEIFDETSDAARVMDTIVSGILYNKFGSSAILNIEGNDYLVKKGDTVNNYHILDIQADNVTVKLGKNTFKAGIGEILTEGSINRNEVSNLDKKFGGEKR